MPQRIRHHKPTARIHYEATETSKAQLAKMIGEVVYFIRTRDNLIKIGNTTNLAERHTFFGSWDCIMAFYKGNRDDEQRELARFQPYLARGWEYFTPNAELFDLIDEIRADLGVPPVERWGYIKPRSPLGAR